MRFKSYQQYKNRQLYREFNGPLGQPDPAGVSEPVLPPGNPGPAQPMMGTQPGMSMEQPDIYQQFVQYLQTKTANQIMQIMSQLHKDVGMATQGGNNDLPPPIRGASQLGLGQGMPTMGSGLPQQ